MSGVRSWQLIKELERDRAIAAIRQHSGIPYLQGVLTGIMLSQGPGAVVRIAAAMDKALTAEMEKLDLGVET